MKLIISATDGSEGAERAVAFAASLAKSTGAKLLIVHVSENDFSSAEIRSLEQLGVAAGDALEELSRGILRRAKMLAQDRGAMDIETASWAGDPAKVLIEIASRERADVIVAGRRGRGRLEGLLLGSVSQNLSVLAPCAVIIVP